MTDVVESWEDLINDVSIDDVENIQNLTENIELTKILTKLTQDEIFKNIVIHIKHLYSNEILKKYKPEMLPYSVSDMKKHEIICDGDKIECCEFECEKTLIPFPDKHFGCILFCDVMEHLIVDPIWTILEFNRVLKDGGHIVITTPNAVHVGKIFQIWRDGKKN